jgi:hypothetical protein
VPKFSSFTPFGALAYSSKPSRVQTIYEANKANLNSKDNENFDLTRGTNIEAMIYARSRVQAAARYTLDRAYNNANPLKATETLPVLEKEYGLVPAPTDRLSQRRAALAARMMLPGGAIYTNVTNALLKLLGTDFKYYRVTKSFEAINFPTTGGDSPGNFASAQTVIKNYRVTSTISSGLGSPQVVNYASFNPATAISLLNGDTLVVNPENIDLAERVTVSNVTGTTFRATFVNAHDANVIATTQPFPYWVSSQRFSLVIVTRACAENFEKRRQINELMARITRGVSTWDIVPDLDGSHTAPFTVADPIYGRVGYAGITSVAYP